MLPTFIFIGLMSVSIVHFAWALGRTFPASDEKTLARTVAGFKGIETMPPRAASTFVAIATFVAAFWPWVMSGLLTNMVPAWLVTTGGVALSLIFILRGIAGFTPAWRRLTPEQPFTHLDVRYYSPFCLAIGVAFAVLTFNRLA